MIVGICTLELHIPAAQSLKEKRGVVKSLKKRIQNRFNVSIAEVGGQDKWQVATLGMATVSTDAKVIDQTFAFIDNLVTSDGRAMIIRRAQRLV